MRNILTSMIVAVVVSMALIGMAGADPFTYLGKDTTRMNYDLQTTKDITMTGSSVLTGVDAVFNNVTVNGILGVGTNVSDGKIDRDTWVDGALDVTDTAGLNYTTVTDIRASDDGYITDAFAVGGRSTLNATRATSIVNSGTSYLNATSATTIVASGATYLNATTLGGAMAYSVNASTTVSTVRTASGTKTVFGIDAHSANVTLTLPDAATVPGRVYQIGTNVDPGNYYVKITVTTSDKLGGSGGFTIAQTTDAKAGMALVSDGTLYLISGAYGTWAEGTA